MVNKIISYCIMFWLLPSILEYYICEVKKYDKRQ